MKVKPHSPAWYDQLAETQAGYYYPWQSLLPSYHGEDVFLQMVNQHLTPDLDVLEVACAQGELALSIAAQCRSIVGYDRIPAWIDRAQHRAKEDGHQNTTFLCHDSSADANGGFARLPADDNAFDLLLCSKGPFHWIEDARRVARPGARLLMLVPDTTRPTVWSDRLPAALRWRGADNPDWARPAIEQRLTTGGLTLDSWWSFDVPEVFPSPEQLYIWFSWGKTPDDIPSFAEIRTAVEQLFDEFATSKGLEVRYHRYIWSAIVEK